MSEPLRKLFAARLAKSYNQECIKATRLLANAKAHTRAGGAYRGALTGAYRVPTIMQTMLLYAEVAYHLRPGRAGGALSHEELAQRLEADSVMVPELRAQVTEHVREICLAASKARPSGFQQSVFSVLQVRHGLARGHALACADVRNATSD